MKKLIIITFIAILFSPFVYATNQNTLTIKSSSNEVTTDETFSIKLELKLTGNSNSFTAPEINIKNLDPSFMIISSSQSTSMEIINNNSAVVVRKELIIKPTRTGDFKIGLAVAKISPTETLKSEIISIKVKAGDKKIITPQYIPNQNQIPNNVDTPLPFEGNYNSANDESFFDKIKNIGIIDILLVILTVGIIIMLYKIFKQDKKIEKINISQELGPLSKPENLENVFIGKMKELGVIQKKSNKSFNEIKNEYRKIYGDKNINIIDEVTSYINRLKYGNQKDNEIEKGLIEKIKDI